MKLQTVLMTVALTLTAAAAARAAEVSDASLRRCRAIGDGVARLACYDALAPTAPVTPTASLAGSTGPAAAPTAAAFAGSPAVAPAAVVATGAAALPTATKPAAPTAEASFGLESAKAAPQDISSSIVGLFEGWERNTRFKLANGQVWQVSDGSSAVYYLRDPKVTVRRALLGGFDLEIEGARKSPRVKRVE